MLGFKSCTSSSTSPPINYVASIKHENVIEQVLWLISNLSKQDASNSHTLCLVKQYVSLYSFVTRRSLEWNALLTHLHTHMPPHIISMHGATINLLCILVPRPHTPFSPIALFPRLILGNPQRVMYSFNLALKFLGSCWFFYRHGSYVTLFLSL